MYINTLASRRNRMVFARTSAEGGGGGAGEGGEGGGGAGGGGEEFTPITSQEEFDRRLANRLSRHEKAIRGEYKDYDAYKTKAQQFDSLEEASRTEHEAALIKAREEAWNEAMSKTVPNSVKAAFVAEAKGLLSKEQTDALLEDLDLLKYATDDGDPDWEKIGRKVKTIAPKQSNGRPPGFGQGSGHHTSTAKKGEAGLAEAQKRFPKFQAAK